MTNGTERRIEGVRESPSTATTTEPMNSRISGAMSVSFAVIGAAARVREAMESIVVSSVGARPRQRPAFSVASEFVSSTVRATLAAAPSAGVSSVPFLAYCSTSFGYWASTLSTLGLIASSIGFG